MIEAKTYEQYQAQERDKFFEWVLMKLAENGNNRAVTASVIGMTYYNLRYRLRQAAKAGFVVPENPR